MVEHQTKEIASTKQVILTLQHLGTPHTIQMNMWHCNCVYVTMLVYSGICHFYFVTSWSFILKC